MHLARNIIASLLVLLLAGLAVTYFVFSSELDTAVPNLAAGRILNVPSGSTPDTIVGLLASNGVIKHELPLKLFIRFSGSGKSLKAGDYIFDSPISPREALKKLEEGEQGALKITVVEGWNRWDIASAITKIPNFKGTSTNQILRLIADTNSIKTIDPQASSLEGYMFPSTYFLLSKDNAQDVLNQMVSQFKETWQKELQPLTTGQSLSVHDIVTMASIVETEAKKKEERPIIASVIFNRLARKMPLGMDSTLVYASKLAGKWHNDGKVYQSDIDRNSPYNTRKNIGLPFGPVGSPGLASLKAVLQPARTDYIYYVRNPADNSGSHNFYSSEADFERGVQTLRDWEKKRDSMMVKTTRVVETTTTKTTTVSTAKQKTLNRRKKSTVD